MGWKGAEDRLAALRPAASAPASLRWLSGLSAQCSRLSLSCTPLGELQTTDQKAVETTHPVLGEAESDRVKMLEASGKYVKPQYCSFLGYEFKKTKP